MSLDAVTVFLPCRSGSERVPQKNMRRFASFENGLLELKLNELEGLSGVHQILLDSNDEKVLAWGEQRQKSWGGKSELVVRERPNELGLSSTTTDALIQYALAGLEEGHLLWTHVTSPFLNTDAYQRILQAYARELQNGFDSLMTVNRLQTFLWRTTGPLNYDRNQMKWPRTQDLEPIFEINSGVFLVPVPVGKQQQDRIGQRPFLFELDHLQAFDVDWPADFEMAEQLWNNRRTTQ